MEMITVANTIHREIGRPSLTIRPIVSTAGQRQQRHQRRQRGNAKVYVDFSAHNEIRCEILVISDKGESEAISN